MAGKLPSALGRLLVFFLVLLLAPPASWAEDAKTKYKKLQGEIKKQEEKLSRAKKKERSVLEELQNLDKRLVELEREIKAHRRRLGETNAQIKKTKTEMDETGKKLQRHQAWLKRRLRGMQRQGRAEDVVMLLGADDMAGFLRRWHYLQIFARKEKTALEGYKALFGELREKEAKLEVLQARLKRQEVQAARAEASLGSKRDEKKGMLASIRSEKASYAKLVEELRRASEEILEIIRRSEEGDYEGKGFRGLKGGLPWPASGMIALRYGKGSDPQFNTPVFRNGIYIKTPPETVCIAVHEGKVVFADWFKGYGQLVIVNHGSGYHTLYGNLKEIFLRVGDIIEKRTIIGRVNESVMVNAHALYFEVRYKGKPLDPLQWLGKQ